MTTILPPRRRWRGGDPENLSDRPPRFRPSSLIG